MKSVLNVGAGSPNLPIPRRYAGWRVVRLDIDDGFKPDLIMDARELLTLPAGQYDAVYCSHNLEHYYAHDAEKVARGFAHVLKADGFAEVRVPDLQEVFARVVSRGLDIDDTLYVCDAGPITVRDVVYGYQVEIEQSGNDFFAHKTGFSRNSLGKLLSRCGFRSVYAGGVNELEVLAFAFKQLTPLSAVEALLAAGDLFA